MQESCDNRLLQWEKIEHDTANGRHTYRAPVFGGWLVRLVNHNSHPIDTDYQFIPDTQHKWGKDNQPKNDK